MLRIFEIGSFARIILPNDHSAGIHVLMQQHKKTAALRLP